MLLICIKIKPVATVDDLCLDFWLAALDTVDCPAWGVIVCERRTCKDTACELLDPFLKFLKELS